MSDSDDLYGPPLPPGLANNKKSEDSDSSDDQYGPPLPKKSKSSKSSSDDKVPVIGPALPPNLKGGNSSKYSSDSDSDSSDSSDSDGSAKKRKHKKSKTSGSSKISGSPDSSSTNSNIIGPSIPGHLVKTSKSESDAHVSQRSATLGPSLPPGFVPNSDPGVEPGFDRTESDDDDYGIGPSVSLQASEQDCSAVAEFEGRSQKMLKQLTATETEEDKPTQRESWMTELPDLVLGVGFGLTNRQFRTRDASEVDSSWAKTPQEKEMEENSKDGKSKKKKYESVQSDKNSKASKEIEEYNKKHRPKSLLEMHQKKLEKKKKKEKKKNKNKKAERRPFDRDLDMKVNQIDEAQRKAMIKRSQDLGSRFKTGGTGTSFM